MKMTYPMKPRKKSAALRGSESARVAVVTDLSNWKHRLSSANTLQEHPVDLLISTVKIRPDDLGAA